MCRQHPIKILYYTTRNFWLLLIPLARSLVAVKFDVATWLRGAWLDVLVLGAIFLFAYARWFFTVFEITEQGIIKKSGILLSVRDEIQYKNICAVSMSQSAFLRMVHAGHIYIDTNSGLNPGTDIKLLTKKTDADRLIEIIHQRAKNCMVYTFKPRKTHLAVFSLLFSSTLTGVILFATVMYQASKILGREFDRRLYSGFNEITHKLALRVPPAMVAIGLVIVGGWLISFIANLMRHWSFSVSRQKNQLTIKSGFVTKRVHILDIDKINYIDVRQNLFMKWFFVSSVHIHCAGYGERKREIAVLLPITTRNEVVDSLHLLLPKTPSSMINLVPRTRNIMRFLWVPIILNVIMPIAIFIIIRIFPAWQDMIVNVGLLFVVPLLWLMIVKLFAFFSTGIGVNGDYVCFKYCNLYEFHTVTVEKDKICKIKITRTPFQRLGKNCNLHIYTTSESGKKHIVKNLPTIKAQEFISQKLGY